MRKLLKHYIKKNGNIPLTLEIFNEVDASLLATLCLIDVASCIPSKESGESKTFKEVMEQQVKLHKVNKLGLLLPIGITKNLINASKTRRYGELKVHNLHCLISKELNTQSTFFMIDLDSTTKIILFGSTDDTTIGWSENMDLALKEDAECAMQAKQYVIDNFDPNTKYILIGHSKGGMECAYSFLSLDNNIKNNVIVAYDFDGPGLVDTIFNKLKNSEQIDKLKFLVPQGSYIGRVFNPPAEYNICKSIGVGLLQHNLSTWVIENDHFKRVDRFNKLCTLRMNSFNKYLKNVEKEKLAYNISIVNSLLDTSNTKTLTQLAKHPTKLVKRINKLSKKDKQSLLKVPVEIAKHEFQEFTSFIKKK